MGDGQTLELDRALGFERTAVLVGRQEVKLLGNRAQHSVGLHQVHFRREKLFDVACALDAGFLPEHAGRNLVVDRDARGRFIHGGHEKAQGGRERGCAKHRCRNLPAGAPQQPHVVVHGKKIFRFSGRRRRCGIGEKLAVVAGGQNSGLC